MSDFIDPAFVDEILDYYMFDDDVADEDLYDDYDPDVAQFVRERRKEGVYRLRGQDYSLNSPLLRDDLENLVASLRRGRKSGLLNTLRLKMLQMCEVRLAKIKGPEEVHPWIGSFFREELDKKDMAEIDELLSQTHRDHQVTSQVLQAFLHTWTGDRYNPIPLSKIDESVKHWGQKFYDFHKVVMILNAASVTELNKLSQTWGSRVEELPPGPKRDANAASAPIRSFSVLKTKSIGTVIIGLGVVYLVDKNILLDRNLALMIKDTLVARFNTLISMTYRTDSKFNEQDVSLLKKIYQLGDQYLSDMGNLAYDGLALLEPICVDQMCRLARIGKVADVSVPHMVPEDTRFQNHISEALQEIGDPIWMIRMRNLILDSNKIHTVLNVFGCYRHFGHPFLDHVEGVHELSCRVRDKRVVHAEYAERVGSYFVQMMASKMLLTQKTWVVDVEKLQESDPHCPLLPDLVAMKWPGQRVLEQFGDNWHYLPLRSCFELPDMFDQSAIYSDKSHSPDLDEIIRHLKDKPGRPIPTKRVLETLIGRPCTDWKAFLREINDKGLPRNELVIAIRGKERELKRKGRFFALMSWRLREYFVVTEYLIKTLFLPYFDGITMADSLTKLTKKQINTTIGHGGEGYNLLTYANHIDYSKWNNYQSKEANQHVFSAMGQMIGLPNLFTRTHEFFETANVFYLGKPSLLTVKTDETGFEYVGCSSSWTVAWLGQWGGLEGLRQKGWSLTNVLVIMMEAERTTTAKVKILAQGDNQVICVTFSVKSGHKGGADPADIAEVDKLNRDFMDRVEARTEELGLKVNQSERLVSTDFMIYGKVPIFKGNIYPVESKRWSRVTCVTNDQIPSIANVMSTVSSCAMTVAQYSAVPIPSMVLADFLGNFARTLTELHSPALMESFFQAGCLPKTEEKRNKYMSALLYLEPSVGGPCGTALTRYLIRGFPDPVTESLTFWRAVYKGTQCKWVRNLAIHAGHPALKRPSAKSMSKLIENPVALNIRGGINPANILKEAVTKVLKGRHIRNEVVAQALSIHEEEKHAFYTYLDQIEPKFPRFLSALADASILGVTESVISQIANSRTIRNITKRSMWQSIDTQIHMAELMTIKSAAEIDHRDEVMWTCSASRADKLRLDSWGSEIVGATVPHPMEMVGSGTRARKGVCQGCCRQKNYLTLVIPRGLKASNDRRGDLEAYLGSSTSTSTSLSADYETETKIPMVRRALGLYDCFHWFVDPDGWLGRTVIGLLQSLTGEEIPPPPLSLRTGTALHRFATDRQSSGGFSAQSPAPLTWMLVSSDTMTDLSQNYDFMYQGLFCYAQITATTKYWLSDGEITMHFHVDCRECIREIDEEIQLRASRTYEFQDYSSMLGKLKPSDVPWVTVKMPPELPDVDWDIKSLYEMSYHVGRTVGFIYGEKAAGKAEINGGQLFPLVLRHKMYPYSYLDGILDGILRSSAVNSLYRSSRHSRALTGEITASIADSHLDRLSREQDFCAFLTGTRVEEEVLNSGAPIAPTYPPKIQDISRAVYAYFNSKLSTDTQLEAYRPLFSEVVIFPELNSPSLMAGMSLGGKLLNHLTRNLGNMSVCREILTTYFSICEGSLEVPSYLMVGCKRMRSEVRHAVTDQVFEPGLEEDAMMQDWGQECTVKHWRVPVPRSYEDVHADPPTILQRQCPLMSGLREFMFATGSHYKIRSILDADVKRRLSLVGGDGSGGISSWLIRSGSSDLVIFNTLLTFDGVSLRGSLPGPPSAVKALGDMTNRCLNFDTVWQEPSDLRLAETWRNFKEMAKPHGGVDLVVLDMESTSEADFQRIYELLGSFCREMRVKEVLIKCYLSLVVRNKFLLKTLASMYASFDLTWSEMSSSFTSEVYIHAQDYSNAELPSGILWGELWGDLADHPCLKSDAGEFRRALGVRQYNQRIGIPPELIPNVQMEFKAFMSWIGVSTTAAKEIGQTAYDNAFNQDTGIVWWIVYKISNELIWVKTATQGRATPPTETVVSRVIGLHLATLYWQSWATGDTEQFQKAQYLNERKIKFSFSSEQTKHGFWQSSWGFNDKRAIKKFWTMESMQCFLGTWIRLLARLFRDAQVKDEFRKVELLRSLGYRKHQGQVLTAASLPRVYSSWMQGNVAYLEIVGRAD